MPTSAWKQHSRLKGSLLSHPQQEPSGQGRAFQVRFPPPPLSSHPQRSALPLWQGQTHCFATWYFHRDSPPSLMTSLYCLPFPVPLTAGKHANPQFTALIITHKFSELRHSYIPHPTQRLWGDILPVLFPAPGKPSVLSAGGLSPSYPPFNAKKGVHCHAKAPTATPCYQPQHLPLLTDKGGPKRPAQTMGRRGDILPPKPPRSDLAPTGKRHCQRSNLQC